jgi:hypothetical protein
MDPYHASVLYQTIIGKNIDMAGNALKNGYSGPVLGYSLYISNNLKANATLTVGTQAINNDTVTVAGVTFTFKTTLTATAGEVLIGASATTSRQNLMNAVNGGAGAGSTYVALSTADRNKVTAARISCTEVSTTLVFTGFGRFAVAETLTAGGDVWSNKYINCFCGKTGSIELVLQQEVETTLRQEPKQKTTNVLVDALYGIKTFSDGASNFMNVKFSM